MLDEIIGHFGSRLEEVQSQPPDPGSMKTSLEASLHSAQSAPIDHKKAFLKNKTKSFKNLEVVKNLKPDPKNDIEEVVNSSNESKLPKLNIQSNHLLALLNKNKAKSASLGSQNSLDL